MGGGQVSVERSVSHGRDQAQAESKRNSGMYRLENVGEGGEDGPGLSFALELTKQEGYVGRRAGEADGSYTAPASVIVSTEVGDRESEVGEIRLSIIHISPEGIM